MANPQVKNGYVQLATEIVDALAGIRISGEEMQCLWVVLRKTYGWGKKEDWIALSQFVELTGIKKPNIVRALSKLVDKNIVIKKDNTKGVSYGFQKNYLKWKPLSKKITLSKKIKPVIKKDNAALSKKIPTIDTTTKDTITKDKDMYEISFEEFWGTYPKRKGKKMGKATTKEKFFKLKSSELADVIVAVYNYAESEIAKDGFAKDPERFFIKNYWEDWLEPEESASSKKGSWLDKVQ
jgi:phage replication O-like protein O